MPLETLEKNHQQIKPTSIPEERPLLALPAPNQISSRLLLERMLARRQYEARFEETGNDVLQKALKKGNQKIIHSKESIPQPTTEHKDLFESFNSPHNLITKSIFIESLTNLSDKQKIMDRYSDISINSKNYLPLVYGTSGTETNSKEIGNTLGSVNWLKSNGQQSVGIYFVEDEGHPLLDTIIAEAEMTSFYLATKKGISLIETKKQTFNLFNKLYSTSSLDIYHPQSKEVQNLVSHLSNQAEKEQVLKFFEKTQNDSHKDSKTKLSTTSINIPCPTPELINSVYTSLDFPSEIISTMVKISESLYKSAQFQNPTIADFRTILQGVLGLQLAYHAFGAPDMPIWAVDTWSNVCQRTNLKENLTLSSAKELIEKAYPGQNRRVINFACPSCQQEHGIDSNNSSKTNCDFEKIIPILDQIKLSDWKWGSNSGIMYYELFSQMSEKGDFAIFLDNYEANGPQTRLTSISSTPSLYAPENRTWVVGPNPQYKKNSGKIDGNSTLGTALPSELLVAYLYTLPTPQKNQILNDWLTISGESGVGNNMAVLKIDIGSAQLRKTSFSILDCVESISPNIKFDHAPLISSHNLDQILKDLKNQPNNFLFPELSKIDSLILACDESIKRFENILASNSKIPEDISKVLSPLDEHNAKMHLMRRQILVDLLWKEKSRLIKRNFYIKSNKLEDDEISTQLKECLAKDDKQQVKNNHNLASKLLSETTSIWAEDKLEGKQERIEPIKNKKIGLEKENIIKEIEHQVKDILTKNKDYILLEKESIYTLETLDWNGFNGYQCIEIQSNLRKNKKNLEQRVKLLQQKKSIYQGFKQRLINDLITSIVLKTSEVTIL